MDRIESIPCFPVWCYSAASNLLVSIPPLAPFPPLLSSLPSPCHLDSTLQTSPSSPLSPFSWLITVYHVGPNGWTQVWAGDTTDMYYKYYPLKNTKSIETEEEKANQEAAAMTFGHGAWGTYALNRTVPYVTRAVNGVQKGLGCCPFRTYIYNQDNLVTEITNLRWL
jgi:hypothetical protein